MSASPKPPPGSAIDPGEWQLRVDLAATYRIFALWGWDELIYNHITVRLPGPGKRFLINPFGLHYSEVTASNLLCIDVEGNSIGRADWPVNPAGFTVHAAIHDAIPQAHCVMHTHTTAGMAVACSRAGLSMDNFYGAQLHDKLAYHDFEGITVRADEGPRLVRSIGDRQAVILRNHGLLAWGDTLPRTLAIIWLLNRACEVQVATATLGKAIPIPLGIRERCAADSLQFHADYGAGQDMFDAMVRRIDRIDPSWRY